MKNREISIINSRPQFIEPTVKEQSSEELFQNATLRPVVKYQEELILEVFRNYITKHKNGFYDLNVEQKISFIDNAVQKDIKFRNTLKGVILGQFTVNEYLTYSLNSSALNKRIMWLIREKLCSNLQLFEMNQAG